MHMHGTMGSSPEVLSWTSCPSLLVGKLKEELKLTVVGDALKKANTNSSLSPQAPPPAPPPQIITDLAPPTSLPVPLQPGRDDDLGMSGSSPPCTALSEDSSREQGHFENSVLQLQEHEEERNADHEEHGSYGEEGNEDGGCNMEHADQHHHDDIKLHFHRAHTGGGGFLEGLFGCLKPVWNIIGKTYSTDYKLQQQGVCNVVICSFQPFFLIYIKKKIQIKYKLARSFCCRFVGGSVRGDLRAAVVGKRSSGCRVPG